MGKYTIFRLPVVYEIFLLKLLKSNNACSSYSEKCRGCFWDTVYFQLRDPLLYRKEVSWQRHHFFRKLLYFVSRHEGCMERAGKLAATSKDKRLLINCPAFKSSRVQPRTAQSVWPTQAWSTQPTNDREWRCNCCSVLIIRLVLQRARCWIAYLSLIHIWRCRRRG